MEKNRSRVVASRGKKGKCKVGSCSNPPPSELNHKKEKVKAKVKKNKKKNTKEEEKKPPTVAQPILSARDEEGYLDSDESWDGLFFIGPNGKRHPMAFGLIWSSSDEE